MTNLLNPLFLFLLWILVAIPVTQITAQRSIGPPALEIGSQYCATQSVNAFTVVADLFPGDALPFDNEFILQLSDANGAFSGDGTELARVAGPNQGTPSTLEIEFENISVPTDLVGSDNYRFRIQSSAIPAIISQPSAFVALYFFNTNYQISLNDRNDLFVCSGTTINETLSVTVRDISDGSIVDSNTFTWEWLRDGNVIVGQNQASIQITQQGTYQARVPLGKCQFAYLGSGAGVSNFTDVILVDSNAITISTTAPDLSFCPEESDRTLISSENNLDFTYQWYKDGSAIPAAITSSYVLPQNNFQGQYTVEVGYSDACKIPSQAVTVSNEGSSITQPLPEKLILLPNQIIQLQIITDAPVGSIYRWIVDTNVQSQGTINTTPPTTLNFEALFVANYKIEIEANDACSSELESVTDILTPANFQLSIGPKAENPCESNLIELTLLEMQGITNPGQQLVPLTEEQLSFFDFEWYKDGNPTGIMATTAEIDREQQGSYTLQASLKSGGFTNLNSNALVITSLSPNFELIANPAELPKDGSPVRLTAPENPDYAYAWFRVENDVETLIEGENTNVLNVTQKGIYFVQITNSICVINSQQIAIGKVILPSKAIPNVITPNNDDTNDNWLLPDEYKNQSDILVTIYNSRGELDFTATAYQNNWPTENSASQGKDSVYYYIITKNNTVIRKGSITVIR